MRKDSLSPTFRALADPTRRWYLEALRGGDLRLIEFREISPFGPSSVLHHLRILEDCGLLRSQKEGTMRIYSLLPEGLREAQAWLREIRIWETQRCLPHDWGRPGF